MWKGKKSHSSSTTEKATFVTSSRILNDKILEILPLFMRDFVLFWYKPFISDDHEFPLLIEETLAAICRSLEERLKKVDWTEILMIHLPDLLNEHLNNYRISALEVAGGSTGGSVEYHFLKRDNHPCCQAPLPDTLVPSPGATIIERDVYLRKISELVVASIVPGRELKSLEIRTILTDLLAFSIFQVLIDSFSEPLVLLGLIATAMEGQKIPDIPVPSKTAPATSWVSVITRMLNPIQLIKSTARSIFNFFAPSRIKLHFREVHWLLFLDSCLHWTRNNPLFTQTILYFIRPVVYFFWGDAIQKYLRDFVAWVFSPPRLVYYLNIIQSTYWPNDGEFYLAPYPTSEEEVSKLIGNYRSSIMSFIRQRYPNWAVHTMISRKDVENGVTEILDMISHRTLNRVLIHHLLDLLIRKVFPEFDDNLYLAKITQTLEGSDHTLLPSPSTNRARSRFFKNRGLPNSRTCHRHASVNLVVEEDYLICEKCRELYCRLLCTASLYCVLHKAWANACQCYRGTFLCSSCFKKQ